MKTDALLSKLKIEKNNYKDMHIIRFYSSFVAISNGKVIKMTNPNMTYCPLANYLYKGILNDEKCNTKIIKEAIKSSVERKISEFGLFTDKREIVREDIAVPFGASEMLMYCLKKKIIDAAVVVCDGAGTVIVEKPEVVQGIGARMNGLFYTTPILSAIKKLENEKCKILSPEAEIDQIKGVELAASLGYKKIAVTVNGFMDNDLIKMRNIEKTFGISVIILIVCTTGMNEKQVNKITRFADIVWSCASNEIRSIIGKQSILQLSEAIPVFVLTKKGLSIIAGYSSNEAKIRNLDMQKQYLITRKMKTSAINVMMGNFSAYLVRSKLPVRSSKEPVIN